MDQRRAPVYEALQEFRRNRVVPFDVPGHKRGRGNPELVSLLGKQCVELDVNSMKPLDNLCHPISVIKEAENLFSSVVVQPVTDVLRMRDDTGEETSDYINLVKDFYLRF